MRAVSEQVSQEIQQSLKSMDLPALSSENMVALEGQLQNIAKKENCVRSVIGERTHMWAVRMLEGEGPTVARLQVETLPLSCHRPSLVLGEVCTGHPAHPT